MGSFTLTRTTPASPDAVWEVLDDFGSVAEWGSGVARAKIINGVERGVGAERHCDFDQKGKQWVKERITERGDDHVVVSIFETNAPFRFLEATIRVRPAGSGSEVVMTMDMVVKGGPLGKLMEVAMVRPGFKKAVRQLLADLDAAARKVRVARA